MKLQYKNLYLPPELWKIIFDWKYNLEKFRLKYIHIELIDIMSHIHTTYKGIWYNDIDFESYRLIFKKDFVRGDNWYKYLEILEGPWKGSNEQFIINVKTKCGIEILNYRNHPVNRFGMPSFPIFCNKKLLHIHLTENLGITCSKNAKWKKMIRLLRTV
jgi:hypothetical protein